MLPRLLRMAGLMTSWARPSVNWKLASRRGSPTASMAPVPAAPHGRFYSCPEIRHTSANSFDVLGFDAEWLLGQKLAAVFGDCPFEHIIDVVAMPSTVANPAVVAVRGKPFDAIAHRSGELIIDLEPSLVATDAQFHGNALRRNPSPCARQALPLGRALLAGSRWICHILLRPAVIQVRA